MATLNIKGQKLTVKGELPNGRFYLEGPHGGSAHFALPLVDDLYTIRAGRPGACSLVDDKGILITLTREELTAGDNLTFKPEAHSYNVNGARVGGVTSLLSRGR